MIVLLGIAMLVEIINIPITYLIMLDIIETIIVVKFTIHKL